MEPLYDGFLREAYRALRTGGKAVFVTPHIRTRRGVFQSLNIEKKAASIGFRTILPFEDICIDGSADDSLVKSLAGMSSLVDIAERHKIGREIHILQKQ